MTERERGILTEKQREYLRLDEDERREQYSRQQRYRLRKTIRQRVANALLDFDVLFRGLDTEELAEIVDTDTPHLKGEAATVGVPPALAFLARVENTDGQPVIPGVDTQPAFARFTRSLEKGLHRYIARDHRLNADVSVSIDVPDVEPVDDLTERLEAGDADLDPSTLSALTNAGVTGDDLARLVEQVRDAEE